MDGDRSHGDLASIKSRAREFLAQVEWLTSTTPTREDAVQLIFGPGGPYTDLFPTMDDRLALRECTARELVFEILSRLPSQAHPTDTANSDRAS